MHCAALAGRWSPPAWRPAHPVLDASVARKDFRRGAGPATIVRAVMSALCAEISRSAPDSMDCSAEKNLVRVRV